MSLENRDPTRLHPTVYVDREAEKKGFVEDIRRDNSTMRTQKKAGRSVAVVGPSSEVLAEATAAARRESSSDPTQRQRLGGRDRLDADVRGRRPHHLLLNPTSAIRQKSCGLSGLVTLWHSHHTSSQGQSARKSEQKLSKNVVIRDKRAVRVMRSPLKNYDNRVMPTSFSIFTINAPSQSRTSDLVRIISGFAVLRSCSTLAVSCSLVGSCVVACRKEVRGGKCGRAEKDASRLRQCAEEGDTTGMGARRRRPVEGEVEPAIIVTAGRKEIRDGTGATREAHEWGRCLRCDWSGTGRRGRGGDAAGRRGEMRPGLALRDEWRGGGGRGQTKAGDDCIYVDAAWKRQAKIKEKGKGRTEPVYIVQQGGVQYNSAKTRKPCRVNRLLCCWFHWQAQREMTAMREREARLGVVGLPCIEESCHTGEGLERKFSKRRRRWDEKEARVSTGKWCCMDLGGKEGIEIYVPCTIRDHRAQNCHGTVPTSSRSIIEPEHHPSPMLPALEGRARECVETQMMRYFAFRWYGKDIAQADNNSEISTSSEGEVKPEK
ncbi:hypothetical protein K438DRAFT_1759153 [Mycena galopus ATCC 62051]|nr:hypothetical protein K438DRAFT_1759153 [Mycena galopus ATCC 62051]